MECKITEIVFQNFKMHLYETNEATRWRADTFWTKEPETIEWINSFLPDDVFIDVGANIGLYSLYAAAFRGSKVFAFEPESLNYALLNRNIFLNDLDQKIKAYPIALNDQMVLSELHLGHFGEGSSCHNFQEKDKI